ncbi:ABC-2 type transporter [Corchorus olitorius]|uniref:ABC-2 type transporter n=1 Tax=Corchorus olitorius TaxID=93759 RepID=A0A1R3H896_9ROSI|nr:ABC-2 type transporter [Corchorus olitorius]
MDGTEKARTRSSRKMEDVFGGAMSLSRGIANSSRAHEEEEEALRWAAIEKLPTYHRLRTSIINSFGETEGHGNHQKIGPREVDVRKLDMDDRKNFINALFKVAEEDNDKFLKRFRDRIDKVGIQLPTVEVRFEHLNIEADTYVGSRALPTLPNVARNIAESALGLDDTFIRPTSFWENNPFTCLGRKIGPKLEDLLSELARREKSAGIYPEAEVDLFMKATAIEGAESSLATDYILKVTSRKDQAQYWADRSKPYRYIPVSEFANRFKKFHVGVQLENELSVPFDKSRGHRAALVFTRYSVPKLELLKACWDKEVLLIKRNSFFYVFKTSQIIIVAFFASTVFLRTRMHHRNEEDGMVYNGALLFSLITNMFNGYPEISLMIMRLPVFFKQRDLFLYPAWAFTIPLLLTKIPIAIFESVAWMVVTYYSIGFAPEADRFFKTLLALFMIQQVAASLFRLISGVCRTMVVSNTGGMFALMFVVLLGGFTLSRTQIPIWWKWGYWCSPMTYGYDALAVNEFYAPRWMNRLASDNVTKLGEAVLESLAIYRNQNLYWISIAALLGFILLFNVLFTLALTYLNAPSSPQAIVPEETVNEMDSNIEMAIQGISSRSNSNRRDRNANSTREVAKKGMVLPFTPLAMRDANELTMITGAMYIAVMFLGVNNCQTAQPVVAIERTIFYRERAAGMYSALPYALAQVIVEVPYVLTQSAYYAVIVFAMIQFKCLTLLLNGIWNTISVITMISWE